MLEFLVRNHSSVWSFPHLTYEQEMKRLQKMLEEVSSDEYNIKEFDYSDNEDIFSEHQSKSEGEYDSS